MRSFISQPQNEALDFSTDMNDMSGSFPLKGAA